MQYPKIATAVFFAALVALGVAIHRDYGLSWDEPVSHKNGEVSLAYVLRGDPELWTYRERYYGVLFELPFAALQEVWKLPTRELFFVRHLGTFLFFAWGVYMFYSLCLWRWKSPWMALLGAAFLVLSPRIFADGFYNSKDIPTLVLFIVAIYTLSQFLEKPGPARAALHALASAALIALRLPGLLVPALTLGAVSLLLIADKKARKSLWQTVGFTAAYAVLTAALTVLFWPFLWQDPLPHFAEAFADMSHFSRLAGGVVLYRGEFLKASELPWHYIPTWIAITTPLLYLGCFLVGTCAVARRFVLQFRKECSRHCMDLVVLAWFFGPIAAIIALQSVVYDGWRHLYFVYPAFIYVALLGAGAIAHFAGTVARAQRKELQAAAGVILAMHLVSVASFMIRSHPYQNVYFNVLAGNMESARRNFDLDYWGLAYREGLEYIANMDKSAVIPVYFLEGSVDHPMILPAKTQQRIRVLTGEGSMDAKYFLSNYRLHPYEELPLPWEIYAVKVNGTSIMSIFQQPS